MKAEIKNLDGKKVGDVTLDDAVFGADVNEHLLWEVVKMQRAKRRAGTHSTLRRDEVRGGGKKPYKQKGTGNARQGSTRSPHYVGGGSVFGPKPRDYGYDMPKKAVAGALRCVLSLRAKESKLVIVDGFVLGGIKTAKVATAMKALGLGSALLVDGKNVDLEKSARNHADAKYLSVDGLNVYDVLNHETLVLTKGVLADLEKRLKPLPKTEGAAAKPKPTADPKAAPKARTTKVMGGAA